MVPTVKITPIEINIPEPLDNRGPFDRSYLSPEPFETSKRREIDPFSHKMYPGPCDILKICIMTFTIAPLRQGFLKFLVTAAIVILCLFTVSAILLSIKCWIDTS